MNERMTEKMRLYHASLITVKMASGDRFPRSLKSGKDFCPLGDLHELKGLETRHRYVLEFSFRQPVLFMPKCFPFPDRGKRSETEK